MKRKNLKMWHARFGITQTEVSEVVGVTKQHYSAIINGRADPSFNFIEKFTKHYGDKIDDIWELFKKE